MKKIALALFFATVIVIAVRQACALRQVNDELRCLRFAGTGVITTSENTALGNGTLFMLEVAPLDEIEFFEGAATVKQIISNTDLVFDRQVDHNPDGMPYTIVRCHCYSIFMPLIRQ